MSDKKTSVCVLLTTYNRAETTLKALNTIDDPEFRIDYLVVDDNSSDGTRDLLREWKERDKGTEKTDSGEDGKEEVSHRKSTGNLMIIKGSGSLYWAGGMRLGMKKLLEMDKNAGKTVRNEEQGKNYHVTPYDYLLLINDDVEFYPGAIKKMVERSKQKNDMPVTGATKGKRGSDTTYGGVFYDMEKAKPRVAQIKEADLRPVDTMNCNAFLMPWEIFRKAGAFDGHYIHSLADHDYGFTLKGLGYKVWLTDFYVGECDDNSIKGTWRDTSLGPIERLKKKESVKGLPREQWYYYLKKNFGLKQAIWHSITPYIRILTGK